MKLPSLPILLSFNGGYVDTLGFLSLSGLFTAHVTGNFVTLGATLAHGLDGALSKLLALPVFCLVVFVSRLVCLKLQSRDRSPIRTMLVVKLLLFVGVAAYALYHGPFRADEGTVTLAVGMALVSAMAIQNGLHKAHLSKAPPSTLMTGTTTQIMLDLADILADPNGRSGDGQGTGEKDGSCCCDICSWLRSRRYRLHLRSRSGVQPAGDHRDRRSLCKQGRGRNLKPAGFYIDPSN